MHRSPLSPLAFGEDLPVMQRNDLVGDREGESGTGDRNSKHEAGSPNVKHLGVGGVARDRAMERCLRHETARGPMSSVSDGELNESPLGVLEVPSEHGAASRFRVEVPKEVGPGRGQAKRVSKGRRGPAVGFHFARTSVLRMSRLPPTVPAASAVGDPVRLTAVRRTGLLDTLSEPSFDRLTRLAAKLTGAPVTFVSLVDEQRDFYKSCFGFPEPLATTRQVTGPTFCHHAIESEGPLAIHDTLADPVYRNVPTVTSLGVRAYLGIPMQLTSGERIGSFCAIDFQPRTWSPLDLEVMTELAASTLREIELRMAADEADRDRRRMRELADSNEQLYRQAHEANRQKDLFFAAVTHELRNPMTSIIGWAQVLRTELEDNPPAAEALAMIEGSARAQARMVNDLLDTARIAAGKIELHRGEVDVNSVIEEALLAARPGAQDKGVALRVDASAVPLIPADRVRVRQVLDNLITNAIKFTPAGGSVTVISAPGPDAVRIEVRDTGRGIDPAVVAQIFDRGWQVRSAEQGGLGLGLGIARHLTLLHGGSIAAESEGEGKGASFIVTLPLRAAAL